MDNRFLWITYSQAVDNPVDNPPLAEKLSTGRVAGNGQACERQDFWAEGVRQNFWRKWGASSTNDAPDFNQSLVSSVVDFNQ